MISYQQQLKAQSIFEQFDGFFSAQVTEEGMVNYQGLKENPQELQALVKAVAELDLSNKRVSPEYLKAFYINAYNVLVINQIVENYPTEGPLAIDGFFDKKLVIVMGNEMTLNDFEKGKVFPEFPDAKLHFVLVCGAKGCPPLANSAYFPEGLEENLTKRTSYVLNLDWFVRVKKKRLELSKIFEWYRSDFETEGKKLVDYVNQFREMKIDTKGVGFYEYDWSLNELE